MTFLEQIEQIVGNPVELVRDEGNYAVVLRDVRPSHSVAWFQLDQLQGCCGVLVSYHAAIGLRYRGKGLGYLLNKMRQQIAWNRGYTVLICTDVLHNEPQQKILERNGWTKLTAFENRRTGNDVGLHIKHLEDSGIQIGNLSADYQEDTK